MSPSLPTRAGMKASARVLRQALAGQGHAISHSQALEIIARQQGVRDWNTASALAPRATPMTLHIGMAVQGTYLGCPFTGKVLGLTALTRGLRRVTVAFDTPVDVVRFASFSSLRRRVTSLIDDQGICPRRLSDGTPQLVVRL